MSEKPEAITRIEMQLEIVTSIGGLEKVFRKEMSEFRKETRQMNKEVMAKLNGMPQAVDRHTKDIAKLEGEIKDSNTRNDENFILLSDGITKIRVDAAKEGKIYGFFAILISSAIGFFVKQ